MQFKKLFSAVTILILSLVSCSMPQQVDEPPPTPGVSGTTAEPATSTEYNAPYGVNNWQWPQSTCSLFNEGGINRYRVMVVWRAFEKERGQYQFAAGSGEGYLENAFRCAEAFNARISLVVYRPPEWAFLEPERSMAYDPNAYADFVTALLDFSQANYPGIVEAVEIENETPTNPWREQQGPVFNTDQRDPSQYYINILRQSSAAVHAFNDQNGTQILVVMDGIWEGAYHHLDELYQLGCKDCFDRINFHYYLLEQSVTDRDKPQDPLDASTIWHFPTVLGYLHYIASEYGDSAKPIWLTEFGWRYPKTEGAADFQTFTPDPGWEALKAEYTRAVMETARLSGYVERTNLYVGAVTPLDTMSLLYVARDWDPGAAADHVKTPLYDFYSTYTAQYPGWGSETQQVDVIPAASKNLVFANPDFEDGVNGWDGLTLSADIFHGGKNSGSAGFTDERLVQSGEVAVETGRLYEVRFWVKLEAADSQSGIGLPLILQKGCGTDGSRWMPPNYWGMVDTSLYPGGWRQIRFPYVAADCVQSISVAVLLNGEGRFWIDDLQVKSLDLTR